MVDVKPLLAVAAGGTGGHIYPALATVQALKKIAPEVEMQFICGQRAIEQSIYEKNLIHPVLLPLGSMGQGFFGKVKTVGSMLKSRHAMIRKFKQRRPFCLLSTGSYVSFGPVSAAQALNIPTVLHEQNSLLGKAHQIAAKKCAVIACAYDIIHQSVPGKRVEVIGNPVREEIFSGDRSQALEFFKFNAEAAAKRILISGGSQGAQGVNQLAQELLKHLDKTASVNQGAIEVIWSCGDKDFPALKDATGSLKLKIILVPFIDRMDLAYAACDLVLARAGALSIAEITACGKPSVLVPLPFSTGGHQKQNAEQIAKVGGAIIAEETNTKPAELAQQILELLNDKTKMEDMKKAAAVFGKPNAAEALAKIILEFIK